MKIISSFTILIMATLASMIVGAPTNQPTRASTFPPTFMSSGSNLRTLSPNPHVSLGTDAAPSANFIPTETAASLPGNVLQALSKINTDAGIGVFTDFDGARQDDSANAVVAGSKDVDAAASGAFVESPSGAADIAVGSIIASNAESIFRSQEGGA
jgi:hypothetical protein